jgi:uncharacterized membrane protein
MKKVIIFLVSLAVFGLSISNAFAHGSNNEFCIGPWSRGMGIFPLIGCGVMIFICFVAMILFCSRRFNGPSFWNPYYSFWKPDIHAKGNNSSETAIDILNRRYASGEISKEEYENIKRDIS